MAGETSRELPGGPEECAELLQDYLDWLEAFGRAWEWVEAQGGCDGLGAAEYRRLRSRAFREGLTVCQSALRTWIWRAAELPPLLSETGLSLTRRAGRERKRGWVVSEDREVYIDLELMRDGSYRWLWQLRVDGSCWCAGNSHEPHGRGGLWQSCTASVGMGGQGELPSAWNRCATHRACRRRRGTATGGDGEVNGSSPGTEGVRGRSSPPQAFPPQAKVYRGKEANGGN